MPSVPGVWSSWTRQASLLDWRIPFGRALQDSLPGRLLGAWDRMTGALLTRHGQQSLAIRFAPWIASLVCGAMLFVSPLVGTGLNALAVLAAFAAYLFRRAADQARTRAGGPAAPDFASELDLPFLAVLVFSVLAVAFSPFFLPSVKGLAKLVIFWLAYLTFRGALADKRGRRVLFLAVLLAGAGQGLLAVWQHHIHVQPLATWEDAHDDLHLTRVYGSLRNPNLLAGYFLPIVPFALGMAAQGKRVSLRWLGFAAAGLMMVGIVFTYSRGAYLGLAAEFAVLLTLGLVALWPRLKADRRAMLLAVALLALAALAGAWVVWHSPSLQGRIASIASPRGDSSNSFRMNVWHSTLRLIHDSWWMGVGVGNDAFRKAYALYMMSGFEALGAYNIYLEVAAEMGVFGLLAFLWFLRAMVGRALRVFLYGPGPERFWAAAAIAALAGLCVHGLFDTVFYRPSVQLLFWLVVALIVRLDLGDGRLERDRGAYGQG